MKNVSEKPYDHDSDPNEWHNIAGKPSISAIKKQHAEWIDRLSPLAKLPRLRKRILANTRVTDIDALSAIPDLKISFDEQDAE